MRCIQVKRMRDGAGSLSGWVTCIFTMQNTKQPYPPPDRRGISQ